MFRKDIANAKAWSLEKVESCARAQQEITQQAVRMLRPGGMMLYSTCTFSAEENEETIAKLLDRYPEMELLEIPYREGFSQGMPQLLTRPYHCVQELKKCVRIFPHKMEGEGHFLALLKKKGVLPGVHAKNESKSGRPSKEETRVLKEFLQDVSMEWSMEQIEVRAGQVYLVTEPPKIRGGIPFLRNGLYLGEMKRDRFEPAQSFAMALRGEEYASVIHLDWKDERVRRYLCGETLDVEDLSPARSKGWQLVCVNGYPLGWGKLVNGTLKNKLHQGWRMQV